MDETKEASIDRTVKAYIESYKTAKTERERNHTDYWFMKYISRTNIEATKIMEYNTMYEKQKKE